MALAVNVTSASAAMHGIPRWLQPLEASSAGEACWALASETTQPYPVMGEASAGVAASANAAPNAATRANLVRRVVIENSLRSGQQFNALSDA
jgi:hypothetical protein